MRKILASLFLFSALVWAQTLPLYTSNSLQGVAGTGSAITYTVFGAENVLRAPVQPGGVIAQGVLGTSAAAIYTVPAGYSTAVSAITLANTTSSAVSGVILYLNGGAAGNQISPSLTIPANGSLILSGSGRYEVLDASGNIQQTGSQAFDSTISAVTTPLALGTTGSALTAGRRDHTHQSPGGVAAIVAASAAITNAAQVQVVTAAIPATFMQAGTTFRVRAYGTVTSSNADSITMRVRVGTTTLTGNIPSSLAATSDASASAAPFIVEFLVTVRTAGASGTVYGTGFAVGNVTAGATAAFSLAHVFATPASVAVDTTAVKLIELTCVTGAGTTAVTFQDAVVEVVKM